MPGMGALHDGIYKAYKPATNSFSSGQVLQEPYTVRKARVVVREMAESAALDLLDKGWLQTSSC